MSQPLPFDEATQALRLDSTRAARVKVDEELTVEVSAVKLAAALKRSAAAFRDLGRRGGGTGAGRDAPFGDASSRCRERALAISFPAAGKGRIE